MSEIDLIKKLSEQAEGAQFLANKVGKLNHELGIYRTRVKDLHEKIKLGMANYMRLKDEHLRLSVVTATMLKSYIGQANILMNSTLLNIAQKEQLRSTMAKFKDAVGVKDAKGEDT